MNIFNSEITFVVQGPIIYENNITNKCCLSIRSFFPGSKIILSTWKNSDVKNLDFDLMVENNDPGAHHYLFKHNKLFNNGNRLILSTYNGLVQVKTKYSIKMRSDTYFQSNQLVNLLKELDNTSSIYTKKKIIAPSNMAFNPDRKVKLLFHPSDSFFAGLTCDILDLFDIPLMDNNHLTYFQNINNFENLPLIPRYTNEQYIFYNFLKKKININFRDAFDFNEKNKLLHDEVFSDIFLMFRNKKIGMNNYKYPMNFFSDTLHSAYTEYEFNKLSNKHGFFDFERLISNILKFLKIISLKISKKLYLKIKKLVLKHII